MAPKNGRDPSLESNDPSSHEAVTADTIAGDGASGAAGALATPAPMDSASSPSADSGANSGADDGAISNADTAVATKSQAMAAATAPAAESGEDKLLTTLLLGRYEVTRKIGQGGMGAVYEATHTLIGKRVAIKVLLDKYAQKDPIVARLEQEAKLASSIGHEHIIDITDFGHTPDGRTFVVMEYLEGESLGALIVREGQLPEQRVIRIARQVASALDAAHDKGVIHRDIKPDNVFLVERRGQDFAKVVDFGISKAVRGLEGDQSPRLTQTGMVLGTPLYMSPEQARGDDDLDHRIDVYALGVILYEMVTGEVPFSGGNYLSILSQVLNDEPTPPRTLRPELSIELESVIMKALSKDREKRYQSCQDLDADLSLLAATEGTTTGRARISAQRYRPKSGPKLGLRTLAWFAGVSVVIAAVAVTISVTMGDDGESSTELATVLPTDAGVKAAPPSDATKAEPEVDIVEIPLVSKPVGADIYHGDRYVGTTPTTLRWPKVNEKIELVAELAGHHDARATINPYLDGESGQSVRFRLKKVKKGSSRIKLRKRPKSSKAAKTGDTTGKSGPDDTAGGELTGDPYKKKK